MVKIDHIILENTGTEFVDKQEVESENEIQTH